MLVMVKKRFNFVQANGEMITFTPGVQEISDEILSHTWAKENTEIFEQEVQEVQEVQEIQEIKPKKIKKEV